MKKPAGVLMDAEEVRRRVSHTYTYPKETFEQQKLITWVDTFHMDKSQYLFAIPNGGSRHPAEAAKLKAEGVRAGVLDLFFYQARGVFHGLFIEMKRRRGSTSVVSGGQRGFIDRARKQGYSCKVCWGYEEARQALEEYWALPTYSAVMPDCPAALREAPQSASLYPLLDLS